MSVCKFGTHIGAKLKGLSLRRRHYFFECLDEFLARLALNRLNHGEFRKSIYSCQQVLKMLIVFRNITKIDQVAFPLFVYGTDNNSPAFEMASSGLVERVRILTLEPINQFFMGNASVHCSFKCLYPSETSRPSRVVIYVTKIAINPTTPMAWISHSWELKAISTLLAVESASLALHPT